MEAGGVAEAGDAVEAGGVVEAGDAVVLPALVAARRPHD